MKTDIHKKKLRTHTRFEVKTAVDLKLAYCHTKCLPIILGRPFLLSAGGIVFPLTGLYLVLLTLIRTPFGGRSFVKFCP